MPDDNNQIAIRSEVDIVAARQKGRALAVFMGFSPSEATLVATAISELARNIVRYAKEGEILLETAVSNGRAGVVVIARDQGPGIANIRQALQQGFSTSGGLGLGLPGVRRLMDDCEIVSEVGQGTTVTAKKWTRSRAE